MASEPKRIEVLVTRDKPGGAVTRLAVRDADGTPWRQVSAEPAGVQREPEHIEVWTYEKPPTA